MMLPAATVVGGYWFSSRQLLKSYCRAWKSSVRVLVNVWLNVFASLVVYTCMYVRFPNRTIVAWGVYLCLTRTLRLPFGNRNTSRLGKLILDRGLWSDSLAKDVGTALAFYACVITNSCGRIWRSRRVLFTILTQFWLLPVCYGGWVEWTEPGSQGPSKDHSLTAVKVVTWLILPVVICLSQRLSHACLSINTCTVKLRMAH